jgi:hypothetical protein
MFGATATDACDENVALGPYSLYSLTTGYDNMAVGYASLRSTTTGTWNVAVGTNAMFYNESGANNLALGGSALYYNAYGSDNIAIGYNALYNSAVTLALAYTGKNIGLGSSALKNCSTGSYNLGMGYNTGTAVTSGNYNNLMGYYSAAKLKIGEYNISIGTYTLGNLVDGDKNIAIGYNAMNDLVCADNTGLNIAIGHNTGLGITTGVKNTILGSGVTGLATTLSNNIIVADGDGNKRIQVDATGNVFLANVNGSSAANGDLILQGTTEATKTTSYVTIQPNGGFTGVNTSTPTQVLTVVDNGDTAADKWVVDIHQDNTDVNSIGFFNDTYSSTIPGLESYIGSTGTAYIGTPASKDFKFYTDSYSNIRMTISYDGYVQLASGAWVNEFSTDGLMAGNSDYQVPTEQAVVEYTPRTGYIRGYNITYKDANEIYYSDGECEVNGTLVKNTTASTAFELTSTTANDFYYIYLAADGTVSYLNTEPAWSAT